jgi:hypothetical protein
MTSPVEGRKPAWDVFIAYPAQEWQHALALYTLLVPNLSVFLDRRSLSEGSDFDIAIPEAQRNSRMTVALIGKHHEKAYYARVEVATAVALARRNPTSHSLVPVYLEGRPAPEDIPYGLQLKQSFDLVHEKGWEAIVTRLLALLRNSGAAEVLEKRDDVPQSSKGGGVQSKTGKGGTTARLHFRARNMGRSKAQLINVEVGHRDEVPNSASTDVNLGDVDGSELRVINVKRGKDHPDD